MPNPLTGDFDAIVQVSQGTVNRLLASLHQNQAEETEARTLPHSAVIRIDDPALTGDAAGLRGTAYLQLGAPTVSLVPGAPHEADVAIWVRARYRADAKTTPMAEFVHAKVVARFRLAAEQTASGPGLRATVSDDDALVAVSEHNLAAADAARVAAVVRWYLRHKVDAVLPLSESLPPGAGELLTIHDAQGGRAVAFPVTLGSAPPVGAEPGGVILESSDFAVAVRKEYLLSLVQPSLDAIKAQHPTFSISVWGLGTAGYTVTLTKAQATWLPDGQIRIDVGGHANTPAWWAPNVSFDVGQNLQVAFTFPALSSGFVVSVVPVGDVSASASAGGPYGGTAESIAKAEAKTQFVQARENALAQAAPFIGQTAAKMQLLGEMLLPADPAAALEYQKVTPGPDGFVIRGRILLSPRKLPRVAFSALQDGSGCTAFDCWVPGGRVKSYMWTWWRSDYPMNVVTGGFDVEHKTHADRFVLQEAGLPTIPPPPPAGIGGAAVTTTGGGLVVDVLADPGPPVWGQICLLVLGEHAHPLFGTPIAVNEELILNPALACIFGGPPIPPFVLDIPIDLWRFDPDPPVFTPVVHLELNGGFTPPIGPGVNVLLSGGGDPAAHTRIVHDALRASTRKDARLLLVVPASPGDAVVSRQLRSVADELHREFPGVSIVTTEARNGEQPWRLLDAAGQWAWSHDGQADSRTLAAALDRHLVATPRLRLQLQAPMVKVGDRAPDFAVDVRSGQRTFLRRFRGRQLALLFAPPHPEMIEPAFAFLRRDAAAEKDGLLPVVVLDRRGRIDADVVRRVLGPETVVASDPDGAIGRQYGVRVRPTLVFVDLDGRISTTQVLSSPAVPR